MTVAAVVPVPYLTSLASGLAAQDQLSSSCGPSIAVSYLLAAGATLAALACAARIRVPARGRSSRAVRGAGWTAAAAVAVGAAVWSTQLAGTVSCQYGGTALFDLRLTVVSGLVVPLASGAGLAIAATNPASSRRLLAGGALAGAGWSAGSFMTISALRTTGTLGYDLLLATLSVVMNVATATVLCWVAFRPGEHYRRAFVAAMLLGAAIRGGYYTALAATRSIPSAGGGWSPGLDPFALGLVTAAGSTIVLMFIAVAAVGGLLQPRVAGMGTTTRPWAPRRAGPAQPPLARPRLTQPPAGQALADQTWAAQSVAQSSVAQSLTPRLTVAQPAMAESPVASPIGIRFPDTQTPASPSPSGPSATGEPPTGQSLVEPRRPTETADAEPAESPVEVVLTPRPISRPALPAMPTMLVTDRDTAALPPTPPGPATHPAHADLTFEELNYVGRSFGGSVDEAVELLELTDDEPADRGLAASRAAINDVPAVEPGDLALFDDGLPPAPTTAAEPPTPPRAPSGRDTAGPRGLGADADSGELVAVLVPVLARPPRPTSLPPGERAAEPPGDAEPVASDEPGRRPTTLTPNSPIWTGPLPADVPTGPPLGTTEPAPGALPAADPAFTWPAGDPLGIAGPAADKARHDHGGTPAARSWAQSAPEGIGPTPRWAVPLWFPPPAWWFLTPALGQGSEADQRADDPSAPTMPLRLASGRPPH